MGVDDGNLSAHPIPNNHLSVVTWATGNPDFKKILKLKAEKSNWKEVEMKRPMTRNPLDFVVSELCAVNPFALYVMHKEKEQ